MDVRLHFKLPWMVAKRHENIILIISTRRATVSFQCLPLGGLRGFAESSTRLDLTKHKKWSISVAGASALLDFLQCLIDVWGCLLISINKLPWLVLQLAVSWSHSSCGLICQVGLVFVMRAMPQ